jgi:ribonuclease-3 family protein
MARIADMLTPGEAAVYKRGRNARVNSVPQHADLAQYHAATGLEALFGWLYLQGMTDSTEASFSPALWRTTDAA